MQERKNIRLLISLLILTAITALLFVFSYSDSTSDIDKDIFKVDDQVDVDRVLIEREGSSIELSYNRVNWQVNKINDADRQLIKVFFATIYQAEAKRKITGSRLDSLNKIIATSGIKVKLMAGEEMMREFQVLGNPQKSETYFKRTGEEDLYVVTIPGYRVYLASIFELNANDWRDKRIFNFNWQNFKSLSASFPSEPQQNFTISFKDQYFGIDGMPASDTTRLNNYLDAISLVQGDRILSVEEANLSENTKPDFQIEVKDIANRSFILRVFAKPENVIGQFNDSTFFQFNSNAIENIGRRKKHFLAK